MVGCQCGGLTVLVAVVLVVVSSTSSILPVVVWMIGSISLFSQLASLKRMRSNDQKGQPSDGIQIVIG